MPEQFIPFVGVVSTDLPGLAPQFKCKSTAHDPKSFDMPVSVIGRGSAVVVDTRCHTAILEKPEEVPNPVIMELPETLSEPKDVVYAARPEASDPNPSEPDISIQIDGNRRAPAKAAEFNPFKTPVTVKTAQVKQPSAPAPSTPHTQEEPVSKPAEAKSKVKLSSPQIGVMRLGVRGCVVSDTLIVLIYGKDDDIIEPPPHGREGGLVIEADGHKHPCICNSWMFETQDQVFTVFVRISDD